MVLLGDDFRKEIEREKEKRLRFVIYIKRYNTKKRKRFGAEKYFLLEGTEGP